MAAKVTPLIPLEKSGSVDKTKVVFEVKSLVLVDGRTVEYTLINGTPYMVFHITDIDVISPNMFESLLFKVFDITGHGSFWVDSARLLQDYEKTELVSGMNTGGIELDMNSRIIARMALYCELPKSIDDARICEYGIEIEAMLQDNLDVKFTYDGIELNPFTEVRKFSQQPPEGTVVMSLTELNHQLLKDGIPEIFNKSTVNVGICPFTLGRVGLNTDRLENPIIAISGSTGKGKSELAKYVATQYSRTIWVTDFGGNSKENIGWGSDAFFREITPPENTVIDPLSLPYPDERMFIKVVGTFLSMCGIEPTKEVNASIATLYSTRQRSVQDLYEALEDPRAKITLKEVMDECAFMKYVADDNFNIYWNLSSSGFRSVNFAILVSFIMENMMSPSGYEIAIVMDELRRLRQRLDSDFGPFREKVVMSVIATKITDILQDTRRMRQPVFAIFHMIKEIADLPRWLREIYYQAAVRLDYDPEGGRTEAIKHQLKKTDKDNHYVVVTVGPDQKVAKVILPRTILAGTIPEISKILGTPEAYILSGLDFDYSKKIQNQGYQRFYPKEDLLPLLVFVSDPFEDMEVALARMICGEVLTVLGNDVYILPNKDRSLTALHLGNSTTCQILGVRRQADRFYFKKPIKGAQNIEGFVSLLIKTHQHGVNLEPLRKKWPALGPYIDYVVGGDSNGV